MRQIYKLRDLLQHASVYLKTVKVMKNNRKTEKPSQTTRDQGQMTSKCNVDWLLEQKKDVNRQMS